ncbi:hypothetical protein C8Q80DRAFT_626478 [Daedaleopsis nitida]|nr:hypothetical protein C8Q80DRAFT_626478 [Daedaleopsis nitida]
MHIARNHKVRQDPAPGLVDAGTTIAAASGTGPLAFDPTATGVVTGTGVPLVSGDIPVITLPPSTTPTPTPSTTDAPGTGAQVAGASKSELPLGVVIGVCVGAFIGVVLIICLFYAWYKRSSDKMSSAARRNAAGQADQQRAYAKSFNRLSDSEKPRGPVPPPVHSEHQDLDEEKNFSMFKKSPSMRTTYTTKTATDEENAYDLPQLEFTKYRPTLAEELALDNPQKPFATAAAAARQNSGISWDGETVADDSFLSMRSVRVESGTMSPTMVMAKMTPPATGSALHRWESAEVFNTEEQSAEAARQSHNPFTEMVEERRARANNPFFGAQDVNRQSRAMRSRSNSRASRTSRAQSMVRGEGRSAQTESIAIPNTNPFSDMQHALPTTTVESFSSDTLPPHAGLPNKPSLHSGSSAGSFGSERAMASLIAALDLSKEEVEQRLRVVSMQGSTISAVISSCLTPHCFCDTSLDALIAFLHHPTPSDVHDTWAHDTLTLIIPPGCCCCFSDTTCAWTLAGAPRLVEARTLLFIFRRARCHRANSMLPSRPPRPSPHTTRLIPIVPSSSPPARRPLLAELLTGGFPFFVCPSYDVQTFTLTVLNIADLFITRPGPVVAPHDPPVPLLMFVECGRVSLFRSSLANAIRCPRIV